jgi:hypothetical protein
MPRPRYQVAEGDVPVVHRWVHAKCRDTVWPQHNAALTAWDQQSCDQDLYDHFTASPLIMVRQQNT